MSDRVQHCLDNLQQQQESIVNAGHRPDRAVSAILDLEYMRTSVIKADRAFMRKLTRAEDYAGDITARLKGLY